MASDSSGALRMANKRGLDEMKHIEVRILAPQQRREQQRLEFEHIATDDHADVLTKPTTREQLGKLSGDGGPRRTPVPPAPAARGEGGVVRHWKKGKEV